MRLEKSAALLMAALFACRSPATGGSTLLFLGRSPAATLGGLSWAPDPDHSRIVAFDRRLHLAKRFTSPRLAIPMAVATLGSTLVVTERTGEAVVFDTAGRVVREWPSPFVAALYGAGGGRVVVVRSPYYVPEFAPEPDTAGLIRILDTLGRPVQRLAHVTVPAVPFLTHLVNAGALAVGADGSVYFAPLVRDEIQKYGPGGALQWTAKRGLFAAETEPAYGKALEVRKALVNLAMVLGPPPDGRLYVLGADDSAATRLRVDVLDTASGVILATRRLGPNETAVAVGERGEIATFSTESLLVGTVAPAREPFAPAFALPNLEGDTITLARFGGTVTLVNFWASWCGPCREEFPQMAKLYGEFDHKDFEIAAISDDVDRGKMRAFVREFRPPFPVLVGGGRMKLLYHYRGLPYSVLLDRRGRVIERIFGFGGTAALERLRETIALEVRAPAASGWRQLQPRATQHGYGAQTEEPAERPRPSRGSSASTRPQTPRPS
jgi:thiol-disulfide isomerase/thioredoxin